MEQYLGITPKASKDRSVFENVLRGYESGIRDLGEVGGAVGDVAEKAIELAYKTGVPTDIQDKIKESASKLIQSQEGQRAIQAIQGGVEFLE